MYSAVHLSNSAFLSILAVTTLSDGNPIFTAENVQLISPAKFVFGFSYHIAQIQRFDRLT
jgi:hypothetical protein